MFSGKKIPVFITAQSREIQADIRHLFRTQSHSLNVVIGRYQGQDREQRIYRVCNLHEL